MRLIVKRDGSTVAFDSKKITRAVALAFRDAKRAAIGVNCEAPSFSSFVSWLRQNEPGTSLGDKEGRFSEILEDTFNGEKIPTPQQMRGCTEAWPQQALTLQKMAFSKCSTQRKPVRSGLP